MLHDPAEIKAQYRYWQRRILFSTIVGYAMFYFVRKNLSLAMPGLGAELGIGKANLGLFLTLHGLLYGVSKFANGFLGDRTNARAFMAVGLLLSAIVNICFGFSSAVLTLGLWWMLNGWVQGMGFPPCARLMAHWFPPKELATPIRRLSCLSEVFPVPRRVAMEIHDERRLSVRQLSISLIETSTNLQEPSFTISDLAT